MKGFRRITAAIAAMLAMIGSAAAFPDVRPGQTVRFAFVQGDDGYRLTKVEPLGGRP